MSFRVLGGQGHSSRAVAAPLGAAASKRIAAGHPSTGAKSALCSCSYGPSTSAAALGPSCRSRSPGCSGRTWRAAKFAARTAAQTVHEAPVAADNGAPAVRFAPSGRPLANYQDLALTLQQQLRSGSGQQPSASACDRALQGLCTAGARWVQVQNLYGAVRQAGLLVSADTYHSMLRCATEACHASDVMELMHHMQQAHGRAPVKLHSSVVSHLLQQRQARGTGCKAAAYELWQQLRASGQPLDAVAYRAGINACVEMGRVDEARQVIDAMRAAGQAPGHGAYNMLMKYHTQRGDMEAARRVFAELRTYSDGRPLPISSYNALLSGFVKARDMTMARSVLDKARREGAAPDQWTYSSYIHGLSTAGRLAEAEAAIQEMEASGLAPAHQAYGAVLDAYVRKEEWGAAERLLARMRSVGLRPNVVVYNTLIKGRCYAREPQAAGQLLDEMRASGLRADATTYSTLVDASVRAGDVEGALDMLSAMRLDGISPDATIYTSLMKAFRACGQHERALEFFSQLAASRTAAVDPMALNCLVALHAAAGQMPAAEEAAECAARFCASQGLPPPPEATFALLQGYSQQRGALQPAITAFRRFLAIGGRPHRKMADLMYRMCLRHYNFAAARQVVRALRLLRFPYREDHFRTWWAEAEQRAEQRQQHARRANGGGPGAGGGPDWDKVKWWFGLPNNYYNSEWR